MYRVCCIHDCYSKRQDVKFHCFPMRKELRDQWLKLINCETLERMDNLINKVFVCNKHFEKRFIVKNNRLRRGAYPTLFTEMEITSGKPSSSSLQNEIPLRSRDLIYWRKLHGDHTYCASSEDVRVSIPAPPMKLVGEQPFLDTITGDIIEDPSQDSNHETEDAEVSSKCSDEETEESHSDDDDIADLPNDLEDYIQCHVVGSVSQEGLKPRCVPTVFKCQRLTTATEPNEKQRKILKEDTEEDTCNITRTPSISTSLESSDAEEFSEDEAVEMEEEVLRVCRVCLASGVRMYELTASGLQDTFEHVSGTKLHTADGRPREACFACCSQLQRFRAFCQMSQKAETHMTKLLQEGRQITEQEVAKCHRLIKRNLVVSKIPLMALHTTEDPSECADVKVKAEVEDEVEAMSKSDFEIESEIEIATEVKTGTGMSERENETEERIPDMETEGEIEIDEIKIEDFEFFESLEDTTERDETCYCVECGEVFPSVRELLKHNENHKQKKHKKANSTKRDVKAKKTKRDVKAKKTKRDVKAKKTKRDVKAKKTKREVKSKIRFKCNICNERFTVKTYLTHMATEHGFDNLSQALKSKESETEIATEVKTRTDMSERENETEERIPDKETEGEIEIDEIKIDEFESFESKKDSTKPDGTCYCVECAEALPSERELLKHNENHKQKKHKQANSTKRDVKAKKTKREVK